MSEEATVEKQPSSIDLTVEERLKLSPYRQLKPIIFTQKEFAEKSRVFYRVYTDEKSFELIEASSAHEAYTKSGLSRVHRIERDGMLRYLSIDEDKVQESEHMYEGNLDLPDAGDTEFAYDDSMEEFARQLEESNPFEEMELGDLHHKHDAPEDADFAGAMVEPEPESVSGDYEAEGQSQPEPEPAPEPMEAVSDEPIEPVEAAAEEEPEPAPQLDDDGELSEEEVSKLLSDD